MESKKVKEIKLTLQGFIEQDIFMDRYITPENCLTLINELKKENARLDKVVKHFQELIEDGKLIPSEQLKQFAERLKDRLRYTSSTSDVLELRDLEFDGIEVEQSIDEILKEFIKD